MNPYPPYGDSLLLTTEAFIHIINNISVFQTSYHKQTKKSYLFNIFDYVQWHYQCQ